MARTSKTKLNEWFAKATPPERLRLAELAGISFSYVRAIIYGKRTGMLEVTVKLINSARQIRETGGDEVMARLPDVQRGDVIPVCAGCPFYQACKKAGMREGIKKEGEL